MSSLMKQRVASLLATCSPDEAQEYFDKIAAPQGLLVTKSRLKGKGLFANKPFRQGQFVLQEKPAVSMQHAFSKERAQVCAHCMKFVGNFEDCIARLLYVEGNYEHGNEIAGISPELLVALAEGNLHVPYGKKFSHADIVKCESCSEIYCSVDCKKAAFDSYHGLLCRLNLEDFFQHALHTNDIFILAAKVIAQVVLTCIDRLDVSVDDATEEDRWEALHWAWSSLPYKYGWKGQWWECIEAPDDADDAALFKDEIRNLAQESLDMLKEGMSDWDKGNLTAAFPELFHLDVWSNIIGMFELNNVSIFVASPTQPWLSHIHSLPEEEFVSIGDNFKTLFAAVEQVCEEGSCEGNGFFPLQACANHSCTPNTHVFKRVQDQDGRAVLVALKDILPGEEITISYIDEDDEYEKRKNALRDYGFVCRCEKCLAGC